MKNKIFLSSMLIMSVAPAMAETFPSNGLMQQNKTYDNAATSTNMDGVYEGTVNAVAEYENILYQIGAGQYLPADSETVITCPAGSYCPGISGNVQYNQSSDQGIQTCPTGYASSADGASSDTQCYRQCSGNVTIAHATGVTGNDYYGNGTDTCAPTGCENGWHFNSNSLFIKITDAESEARGVIDNEGVAKYDAVSLGLSEKNTWAIDFGDKGIVYGQSICSTQKGYLNTVDNNDYSWNNATTFDSLTDERGKDNAQYCYCNVNGYKPSANSSMQSLNGKWVFAQEYTIVTYPYNCAAKCAYMCEEWLYQPGGDMDTLDIRRNFFQSISLASASCEANEITINWSNTDAADVTANNAGTATYGSDVRTPVKAQTVKGKTFKGWRFSKPEQVNCFDIKDETTCKANSNCGWDSQGQCHAKECSMLKDETSCVNNSSVYANGKAGAYYTDCYWYEGQCVGNTFYMDGPI